MKKTAIVSKRNKEGNWVWVQAERQSACGHCESASTCGTRLLSRVMGNKPLEIPVKTHLQVKAGQRVEISLDEGNLLKGSLLLYFLPLSVMILFSMLAHILARQTQMSMAATDLVTILASGLGLFSGVVFARRHIARHAHDLKIKEQLQLQKTHE